MPCKHPSIKAIRFGCLTFADGLKLQSDTVKRVKDNNLDGVLLLLEHEPVYTVGIRNRDFDESLKAKLLRTGAGFHLTNRGGLITFHGPGQFVVYPILNLKRFGLTMKCYINLLEESVISMCKMHFGINAHRSPHTGVWVGDNKLCAIGVHGSRYITSHGLAINCNTDLNWFKHIVPCGIPDKGVTSLAQELSKEVTVEATLPHFTDAFENVMKCRVTF